MITIFNVQQRTLLSLSMGLLSQAATAAIYRPVDAAALISNLSSEFISLEKLPSGVA